MKRKLTLLSVAMMLILAACGGGVKDLANDLATAQKQAQQGGGSTGAGGQGYNAPDASNAQGYFRAAGQADADTPSFPAQAAMTFEMKPEMLTYDITDLVIQIYDVVLDYSGKYTAAEIMEQFESSVVEYKVDKDAYVPEKWIGAGKWEYIRLLPKHEEKACIVLKCDNPTNDLIELKDTYVTQIIPCSVRKESERFDQLPYPEYIWFPRGIRIDCDGLNYENVPQLFSEYEVETIEGNSTVRIEDGLYWNPGSLSYGVYMSAEEDRGISVSMVFYIDSETKEVRSFRFSTFGLGDEGLTITNEVRIEYDIKNRRSGWAESYWFD